MWAASPTSATHISASRTSSRSFLVPCPWNNGSNIQQFALISAAPVCPPANSRTSLGVRCPAAAASKVAFSATWIVCRADAWRAFSSGSRKKPIAPDGWNFCYRGPGTSCERQFVLAAIKRAESRGDSGNSVEGVNTVPS